MALCYTSRNTYSVLFKTRFDKENTTPPEFIIAQLPSLKVIVDQNGRLHKVGGEGLIYTLCACFKVYQHSWYIAYLSEYPPVYSYVIRELSPSQSSVRTMANRCQLIAKFMVSGVAIKLRNHVVGKFTNPCTNSIFRMK